MKEHGQLRFRVSATILPVLYCPILTCLSETTMVANSDARVAAIYQDLIPVIDGLRGDWQANWRDR